MRLDLQGPCADHFPIETIYTIDVEWVKGAQKRNFRMTDWEKFLKCLKDIRVKRDELRRLETPEELEKCIRELDEDLKVTIEKTVPLKSPIPGCKPWWNSDLKRRRKKVARLRALCFRYRYMPTHEYHQMLKEDEAALKKEIEKAKKDYWTQFLENADSKTLFMANRYATKPYGDGGQTRVPTIKSKDGNGFETELNQNEEKSEAFSRQFFPRHPGEANVQVDPNYEYLEPVCEYQPITKEQIKSPSMRI